MNKPGDYSKLTSRELDKGVDWEEFDKQEREDEIAELKARIAQAQKRLAELEAESATPT